MTAATIVPQPMPIFLRELVVPDVAGREQPGEDDEVAPMAAEARVAHVAERSHLADQRADEIEPPHGSFATRDRH